MPRALVRPNVSSASGPDLMTSIRAWAASSRSAGVGASSGRSSATRANRLPRCAGSGSSTGRRFTGIIVMASANGSPRPSR